MAGHGVLGAAQGLQGIAQITVINRFLGAYADGLCDQVQGLLGHADLEGDDAEKMISVGMIGVTLKNLAVPRASACSRLPA